MDAAFSNYKIPEKSKITSERQELLSFFVEEINKERDGKKFKKITGRAVAMKCSHIPTQDLHSFLSECRDYRKRNNSFSKYFFGALKVKK